MVVISRSSRGTYLCFPCYYIVKKIGEIADFRRELRKKGGKEDINLWQNVIRQFESLGKVSH